MADQKKTTKKTSSSRKSSSKKTARTPEQILKILLIIVIVVGLIFGIDYVAQKNDIHNPVTDAVHVVKVRIESIFADFIDQALPEENAPSGAGSAPVETFTADGQIIFPDSLEIPVCAGSTSSSGKAEDHEIRRFQNYVVCYRESYEQAEWAAYCLEKSELVKNADRGDDFRADPEISTGSATLSDYRGSGYDRGHLAPAADFAFSEEAMSESFYLSNMSPQAGDLNRITWQYLEGQVRTWAETYGRVYVVTGPVLEKDASQYDSIGKNKVSVPEYYYKVLLAPLYADEADALSPESAVAAQAIAFILPNSKCDKSFWDYAVSIDEVERRTGLDFFAIMADSLENSLEANDSVASWR